MVFLCMYGLLEQRHFGETAVKSIVRPLFLFFGFFSVESEFKGTVLGSYPLAFVDW